MVHALGVVGDGGAAEFAHDFKHTVVVVHGVGEIDGSVVKLLGIGVIAFLKSHDFLHQGVLKVELQRLVIVIVISHYLEFFL